MTSLLLSCSQGRACTYSICGEYERCSRCVVNSVCGWCDELGICMRGDAHKPYKVECPSWFYHHCYTAGSESYCSRDIQVSCCLPCGWIFSYGCSFYETNISVILKEECPFNDRKCRKQSWLKTISDCFILLFKTCLRHLYNNPSWVETNFGYLF